MNRGGRKTLCHTVNRPILWRVRTVERGRHYLRPSTHRDPYIVVAMHVVFLSSTGKKPCAVWAYLRIRRSETSNRQTTSNDFMGSDARSPRRRPSKWHWAMRCRAVSGLGLVLRT